MAPQALDNTLLLHDFIDPYTDPDLVFEQLPFDHPVYILYSSGTTGLPKCIVHGAGKERCKTQAITQANKTKAMLTTGSPLLPEFYDYQQIKADICHHW